MALKIRLARGGRKKRPFYRIVVQEQTSPRDGRFVERVGHFDPMQKTDQTVLNAERIQHWLDIGAKPSDTVATLLVTSGMTHRLLKPPPQKNAPAAS